MVYRVCRAFTIESGHMLSKHPEACRHPHGHSRRIELVVSCETLNDRDMVVDFKALKLAVQDFIEQFDHAMAINSNDPMRGEMERLHPQGVIVFENEDPTTEVLARAIFDHVAKVFAEGFNHPTYSIPRSSVRLERVRVWETSNSWAEYGG